MFLFAAVRWSRLALRGHSNRARVCRLLDHNGQQSILAGDGLAAFDGGFNRSTQHQLGLPRALIEPQGDPVQVPLREMREIRSAEKILWQQAVGVFGLALCFGVNHVRAFPSIRIPPHLARLEGVASTG